MSRLRERVERAGTLVLDGALATELERRGCDLRHGLWSARVLADAPALIKDVHRSYLEAGSDCIGSAGYQASIPGFVAAGTTPAEAEELYRSSLRLAFEARDEFLARRTDVLAQGTSADRYPFVAASIGPYGAFLADGSEYTGYGELSERVLEDFHRERVELTVEELRRHGTGHEILAFETIPSLSEAHVLARLADEFPDQDAWISFSCRDGEVTCGGQPIAECARELEDYKSIAAIGVNCTSPRFVLPLIERLAGSTSKLILCYPNSGESYDPGSGGWRGERELDRSWEPSRWCAAGATLVGGCCRTTPGDIAAIVRWRDTVAGAN